MQNIQLSNQKDNNKFKMESKSDLQELLTDVSNRANLQFKGIIQSDERLERQDTLKGILYIIDQYRQILSRAQSLSPEQKAKNYHVIFNTVSYITEILSYIQKSSFSFESIKPLVDCVLAIQSNLVLADIKYIEKRTQLYLFICKVYEEAEYYQPAMLLLEGAIKKYEELRKVYELDPPVQKYVHDILDNNLFVLKTTVIKFSIHSNAINPSDWKKKTQEEFKDGNMEKKLICLLECLRTQTRKSSNIFLKSQKNFKEVLVQQGYDLVKPHLDILSRGLKEMKEKIEFQITFKEKTMTQTLKQDEINQEIKKKREIVGKHIKESELKKASKAFPLEYHAQLIYYAFQVKNSKVLEQLLRCAMIRVQCRRIQVPYVTDVKIEVSNTPHINAKQGYDKIPIDLNEANLKQQLRKLRKSGKTDPNVKVQAPPVQQASGKDAKKGGKQAPPPVKQQQPNSDAPTEWQLEQINHKYVYMYVKRSFNPQKAIYDMKVVLGHEQKGPVGYQDSRRIIVPYIQKNEKVITSQVEQYKGMRESTQMVPYIILSHSENGLENEEQRKTMIVDVEPIVGKNPMVPPRLGYNKINMDLRQVPEQFIKMPGQSYIYLTYKTDYQFHLSSRLIELFNGFVELENSYNTINKQTDLSGQEIDKYTELSIIYSLQKLDQFFVTFQQTLKGMLGQQFYLQYNDFLTSLSNQVWQKYLQLPLEQIDYILEQRLNEEIIDHDYKLYRDMIERCKPIFLRGLKVLNLVMVNNKKCDIFLLSKIALELIKLLEENKEYFLASQNAKLAIDRIRMKRDEYLAKSVDAIADRLLPFSITCNNMLVEKTLTQMKTKFLQQRLLIEKISKIKERSAQDKTVFTEQELAEAELEWKLNRIPDHYDQTVAKITLKHSQFALLLSAIDFDLTNIYFRVSLKHADELKKKGVNHTGHFSAGDLSGLADTLVKKLGFLQTKGNIKERNNLKQLQSTLIKAEKLPPPKPQASRPQRKLLQESHKNPYKLSLLLLNLGALNSSNQDKKYYLKESLKSLKECQSLQTKLLENCVQNSIFIFSSMFDSEITPQKMSYKTKPFQDLYNGIWPAQGDRAQSPILVGKNSECIYLKLPPFIYKDKKHSKLIHHMKLFGKASANGVDVSTNCDQLVGTGTKEPVGKIIRVSHLQSNNNYCFAVAPLNNATSEMMEIGKTSIDIPTLNPLPISNIAASLAKVAYQIGEYDVAQEAARLVVAQFTQPSKVLDTKTNSINTSIKLKFNQARIQNCSLLQMRSVAESIYVLALCQKRKLQDMKSQTNFNQINRQEKQREILNLLNLCASLQPALPCPISSISLTTSQLSTQISPNAPLAEGFMLSLFNKEYASPKIRRFGVSIIRRLMAWGLQNNEISLVRRILYKWATRKWVVLGKVIQVPAEQKKDTKKGAKDPKQAVQQQKMIDKFCHYMIEKSPLVMQQFEDSLVSVSDQYSDLLSLYVETVKQSIQQLSQSTDNGPQKTEQILNTLNGKIQLADFMKDSINSFGKVNNTSKFYLEYNCKLMRRALEVCPKNELKNLSQKVEEFQRGELTEHVKLSLQVFGLMQEAIENNIQFSPQSKNWVKFVMDKTQKKQLAKTIEIFEKYEQKMITLTKSLKTESLSLSQKTKDYDYIHMWLSELSHLKAVAAIMSFQASNSQSFKVSYKIKPIYTALQSLNLQNLKKVQKQVQIMGSDKIEYDQGSIQVLQRVIKHLTEGIYSAYCVQNWIKMVNMITVMVNFINFYEVTPFSHQKSQCWVQLSLVAYMLVEMLKKIRKLGGNTFKLRYSRKLENTELQSVYKILKPESPLHELFEPLYEEYTPKYFIPELSGSTSKQPWFSQPDYDFLNINSLVQVIVYSTQTLYLKQKNEIIIQLLREFCNVTEHSFSMQLLPLLLESQLFLLNQVKANIELEQAKMKALDEEFENESKKHKKKRTAALTGEKMQYEIDYKVNKDKVIQALQLLKEERNLLNNQMQASRSIVQQIQRDCNKAALSQKQQKRYVQQFGEDEQNIWKNYQLKSESSSLQREAEERSSLNKLNILSKNRKNLLRDLIAKYEQIYQKLRNNKTSKDTMSEIVNRNEVGNLCYALADVEGEDNVAKAFEYWNDALATIFRKVNPVENYLEIINQNSDKLVANIGCKEILIAIPIIYKISQFCCHKNLNLLRKTIEFCSEIVYKLFLTSLIHPQHLLAFSNYRLKGFDNGYQRLFYEEEVSVGEISTALQYFVMKAFDTFDNSQIVRTLPMITMYEHLVIDVVKKSELAVKAKIMKSIVLARSGQVKTSSLNLFFIAQQKDLPILWLQKSDSLKKQKGQNWYPQQILITQNKPFYAPQNKESIEAIKNINFPAALLPQVSLEIPILFTIAKYSLLFRIYETEVVENFDINEERINNLKTIEVQLREALRKLAVVEEAERLKQEYQEVKSKLERGGVQDEQKLLEKKKTQIDTYMKTIGQYDDATITRFLNKKSDSFRRTNLIELISRTRFTIYKINASRNLAFNCFHIIKNGITNFSRYSYNARKVQSGYDAQIQVSADVGGQAAGKKDDKKGGKKEPEAIKPVAKEQIDPVEEQKLRKENLAKPKRSGPTAFWHIKLTFELGYLLYRQNNFVIAHRIFEELCKNSTNYQESYFRVYAQSYIERCKLRLGELNKAKIYDLISQVQANNFLDEEYVKLVMDFGEIFGKEAALKLYQKGLTVTKTFWETYGMKKYLEGINFEPIKKKYAVTDELTAEQQDMLKKKAKKPVDTNKKGGKDDKKAPKKDDGKKKKEQSKVEYKAKTLKQHTEVNLFEEEEINSASHFREYVYEKHPNFHPVNVYNDCGKRYIKCFVRYWQTFLALNPSIGLIKQNQNKEKKSVSQECYEAIFKLVKIAESYPEGSAQSLMLLKLKSYFEKQQFLHELSEEYLKSLSKAQVKRLKLPYEDYPLNFRLTQLPSYFGFLTNNIGYLKTSAESFRKLVQLIPQLSFILQNDQQLDLIVYEYANAIQMMLQYRGTILPKYMTLTDETAVVQEKKTNRKMMTSTFVKLLQYSIDLSLARKKLSEEYYTFSKKELDPAAKIDEDVSMDIKNIDKQCKNVYPLFLKEATKAKENVSSLDLLTYLLKIRREAQVMTFSNPLQNTLKKCHRILSNSLPTYKQNCIIPLPDLDKPLENISPNMILVKSKRTQTPTSQIQSYLYILGSGNTDESIIYGKFNIETNSLSKILENCYKIQSKLKQSATLSQAVRERNYKQLQAPFSQILKEMIIFFGGMGPSSDPNVIINEILAKSLIKLSEKSISTFISLLNGQLKEQNEQFNRFLKELHGVKYKLREEKGTTFNEGLLTQGFEKTLEAAK